MWEANWGDGVRFLATVTPLAPGASNAHTPSTPSTPSTSSTLTMPTTTVVDRDVNPRANRGDRSWVPVEADLSAWGGQTVRLTLQTLPRDDLNYDWAGWGNPVVATRETARERPPVGSFNPSQAR